MPAAVCHGRRGARLHARGAAPAAQRRRSSARGATPAAQHRRPSAKGKRRRRSAGGAVPAAQRRRRSARGSEGELIGSTQRQSKTATAASRASRRSAATMAMMIFFGTAATVEPPLARRSSHARKPGPLTGTENASKYCNDSDATVTGAPAPRWGDELGVLIPVTKVYSSWLRRHPWPNG